MNTHCLFRDISISTFAMVSLNTTMIRLICVISPCRIQITVGIQVRVTRQHCAEYIYISHSSQKRELPLPQFALTLALIAVDMHDHVGM